MSTPNRIIVMRGPGETRAALLADDTLLEAAHLRDAEAQPGAVYAGRVGERVPKSDDVFVEIGIAPQGVLQTKGATVAAGQLIAVEVLTPARADKGHKLKGSKQAIPPGMKMPGLLQAAPDPVAMWVARYGATMSEIIAAPRTEAKRLQGVLGPKMVVTTAASPASCFDELDAQIQDALDADVPLPSGGRLNIAPTKALIAIDIDSGSSAIDIANTEAMAAIAHHLRLRNLAGHVLVDLIASRARQRVVKMLGEACADDPAQVQIMGLTPSGMIDIVRQRLRPSLAEVLCDASLTRISENTIAYDALRLACRELVARRTASLTLQVAPAVAARLNERLAPALADARSMANGDIKIVARPEFARDRVEVS